MFIYASHLLIKIKTIDYSCAYTDIGYGLVFHKTIEI